MTSGFVRLSAEGPMLEKAAFFRAGVTAPTVIMSLASAGTLIFFHEPIPSLPALLTITMPFDASIDAALEQTDVMPSSSAYRCDIVLWSNSL